MKYGLGRLELEGLSPDEFPELALDTGLKIVTLSARESASYHQLPRLIHKDPFDRMLVWQAINRHCNLISIDKELDSYAEYGLRRFGKFADYIRPQN